MSVLHCRRGNCGNIMCDRYSNNHSYLCEWCFNELCERGVGTDIEEFMASDIPDPVEVTTVTAYEFWNKEFPQSR